MPGEYPPRTPGGPRWRGDDPRDARSPREDRPGQSRPGAPRWQAQQQALRPGASGAHPRPPQPPDRSAAANPYRPYDSGARFAGPRGLPDASARWSADPFGASAPGMMTSAHMEAMHRKRNGFALFHDGNAGHLWRGEVASLVGEGALSIGVIIWLVYLTASPFAVLAAVVALGLPWLLAGPLGASFEQAREPGRLLSWIGRVRVVLALGIVAMHFVTVYPLLYLLLFALGMTGRLRQSLRVAATRVCLAPGEIELVANDLYIGSAIASVVGPLLGALLFLLLGDRIILVGLGAALLFLLAGNSDGFLDALPEQQRGFLLAAPEGVAPDDATRDDLMRAARADDDPTIIGDPEAPLNAEQRELALPEWYQQGPKNAAQAMADIRAGLALAGGRKPSATGLLALLALALVGGGLAVVEVFYLGDQLNLAPLYLGVLVSLEAGGLALGASFASAPPFSKMGPRLALFGLTLTGVALVILGVAPFALVAYMAAMGMGFANALAVTGARRALLLGRDGVERRAVSAAERNYTALVSLLGALLFTFFYAGFGRLHIGGHSLFPGLPINLLFIVAGLGLVLISLMLNVTPGLKDRADNGPTSKATQARIAAVEALKASQASGSLWGDHAHDAHDGDDYDDYDDDGEYTGEYEEYDDDWDDEPPARGSSRDRRDRW